MLTDADVNDFIYPIDDTLVKQKSDHHGFQMDRGTHEGGPDFAIYCERDGGLNNGVPLNGLLFFAIDLKVVSGFAWFDHGGSVTNKVGSIVLEGLPVQDQIILDYR